MFESTDGINNWTLNHDIKIPQALGVEQLAQSVESVDDSWFIMTKSGANIYESVTYPSNVTIVLNNSSTPNPVFYRATSSVDIPVANRSIPYSFSEFRRTNDRVDELENKLRKFGIE